MKSKSIWNAGPVTCGISEVVSPRAVTYSVEFHQWLRSGSFASRTLPTTCVYSFSVSRVSCHPATGIEGQRPILVAAMNLLSRGAPSLAARGPAPRPHPAPDAGTGACGLSWDDVAHTNGGLAMSESTGVFEAW